jgi:hypothetical protein
VFLSVGFIITAVVAALVLGAAGASVLHDLSAPLAWVTASALCVALFVLAKLFGRRTWTSRHVVTLVVLGCLTFSYLLVLGGESTPRPDDRTALNFFALVVMLLGIGTAAAGLPVAILAAALWRGGAAELRQLGLHVDLIRIGGQVD